MHDTRQARLRETLPQDLADLLPHLQQRGDKEAREMRAILEEQQKRLTETARKYQADSQLTLGFNEDEQRQMEANRRHWDKRLNALAGELEREPARIREVYAVRATRLEPVGLVYLWPVTG